MDNFVQKITEFTNTRYMKDLMTGFMGITAITICGSLFTLLKSIPFGPWTAFLASSGLGDLLSIPVTITTDAIALYVVLSMAYQTAKSFNKDGFAAALVGLGCFLLLTPFSGMVYSADRTQSLMASGIIPAGVIGARGMFLAIFTGMLAARLYVFFLNKGWVIKMPDSVPPNVSGMFASLIPGGLTFLVFLLIRYGFSLTSFETAQNFIYGLIQTPLMAVGGGWAGLIVKMVATSFFWLFGIHGGMVAYVAFAPIMSVVNAENLAAFAAGVPCPHPEWAISTFICLIGGGGATLAMNLLMNTKLVKSEQLKALGRLALPSSIFNINEPLVFGMPIILNPFLAVPYLVAPLMNLLILMLLYKIGLFVPTGASFNTFMPFFILGPLMTGSILGVVGPTLCVIADGFLYLPFLKAYDAKLCRDEAALNAAEAD